MLPIIYMGKTTDTALSHKSEFDEKFEDMFADRTDEELEAIKKRYGAREDVLEAEQRIADVAQDVVKHYIENIMPDGFKAQVVSVSKKAALRYDGPSSRHWQAMPPSTRNDRMPTRKFSSEFSSSKRPSWSR